MDLSTKFHQINNALASAAASINLARTMLKDLELQVKEGKSESSTPGTVGKFLGDSMVTPEGTKIDLPANYAAKSMLVYGDTIKMVEEGGEKKFKQIERVKRYRTEGIIAKKEGRWHAVTADASYRVSDAAIEHFNGKEGSYVTVQIPLEEKYAPFATIEILDGKEMGKKQGTDEKAQPEIKPAVEKIASQVEAVQHSVSSLVMEGTESSPVQVASPKPVDVLPPKVTPKLTAENPKPKPQSGNKPKGDKQSTPHQFSNTPKSPVPAVKNPTPSVTQGSFSNMQAKPQPKPVQAPPAQVVVPDASRVLTDEDLR